MIINVFIVDDHPIVRAGLRKFLDATVDIRITGEAHDIRSALTALATGQWDVMLLDIALPGRSGLDAIPTFRARWPALPILVYSGFDAIEYAVESIKGGAVGYLLKDSSPDEIRTAIRTTADGKPYFSPALERRLQARMPLRCAAEHCSTLSPRELDVARRISRGQGLTEIGEAINLSVKTISTHKTNALAKLGCASTAELIRYISENRLDPERPL